MIEYTIEGIDQFSGKYRFTVTINDDTKVHTGALGPDSATHRAMAHLSMSNAEKVKVVSAEGQRAWYTKVQCLEHGHIAYETKES